MKARVTAGLLFAMASAAFGQEPAKENVKTFTYKNGGGLEGL